VERKTVIAVSARANSSLSRIGIGFLVSAVCLALAVWTVPVAEVLAAILTANLGWLIAAAVVQVICLSIRALRWKALLHGATSQRDTFWALSVGFMANNLLPLRAGEAMRVMVLAQRTSVPWPQIAASVLLERALDVACVLALLFSLLLFVPVPSMILTGAVFLGSALGLSALIGGTAIWLAARSPERLLWSTGLLPARFQASVNRMVMDIIRGLAIVASPRAAVEILAWSAAIWAGSVLSFLFSIWSVVMQGSTLEAAFAVASLSVGISLPSSPGFIGVFQLVGQQALAQPFPERYSLSSALAITIIAHLAYYIPTTILGAFGLARLGMSFGSLKRVSDDQAAARQQKARMGQHA
jgi:uncharacterized protein (TIRG00374 family)